MAFILQNLAWIVCIVGLILWMVARNTKIAEAGRIAFIIGLAVVLHLFHG